MIKECFRAYKENEKTRTIMNIVAFNDNNNKETTLLMKTTLTMTISKRSKEPSKKDL